MTRKLDSTDEERKERANQARRRWREQHPDYNRAYYHTVMQEPERKEREYERTHTPEFRATAVQRHREYLENPVVRERVLAYQAQYRADPEHRAKQKAYVQTEEYKAKRTLYIRAHPEFWGNFWVGCPLSEEEQDRMALEL